MSTTTTNYGLIKPDTTDPILIGQLNDNSDAIDAALKENADAIENKPDAADIPSPSTAAPAMDGTAAAGTSTDYARADHVHPSDTSKQDALSAAQLAAANSGIDSAKVEQIETNKNNISIINILSTVTAASGYTIDSKSTLYKQGKHVFGTLIIQKSTAYSTTQYTAATLTYKPTKSYLGGAFLSPDWGVTDIGYVYIHPTSGELKLQANPAYSGSDTYMYVPLDFVTA